MENTYLITFKANVQLTGTVQLNHDGMDGILRKAMEVIKRNVNVEDCIIELGTENGTDDLVTIKEINSERNLSITDVIQLN